MGYSSANALFCFSNATSGLWRIRHGVSGLPADIKRAYCHRGERAKDRRFADAYREAK